MQPTDQVEQTFGNIKVITWTDEEGISINVFTGGTRNSGLSAVYPHDDRQGAIAWYRTIRDAALTGTPTWQIEAQMSALIDAAQAVGADKELIAAVNATMDQAAAQRDASVLVQDVRDIVGDGQGWTALRQQARRDFSKGRVHRQPPTPAQFDRMRQHRNGIVTRADGQPWVLLRAIVRRGYGDIDEVHGRHIIASVRLNARGLAYAEQERVAA